MTTSFGDAGTGFMFPMVGDLGCAGVSAGFCWGRFPVDFLSDLLPFLLRLGIVVVVLWCCVLSCFVLFCVGTGVWGLECVGGGGG